MRTLDRAGSVFLRAILRRMKVLGLNQSALAQRMKVSRAYVSKVLAGDVNISFQTACRFAKALEMDFMPGLKPKKVEAEVEVDSGRVVVSCLIACLAMLTCSAEVVRVPSWLPEDQRFEVEGTSNEVAQVERTLGLMRDSLHPRLCARMTAEDVGPALQWIVHISLPEAAANESVYFDSYKSPLAASAFGDVVTLTNRAAWLSYLPPTVKLALVFDDGFRDSVSRAVPGVDYPGVAYEDEGSTERAMRLTLRAPGRQRFFKVRMQARAHGRGEIEFKWIRPSGYVLGWRDRFVAADKQAETWKFALYQNANRKPEAVPVFAREKGSSVWGVPSYIYCRPDDLGRHAYDKAGCVSSIDYGSFRDVYKLDEKNRIIGFERLTPGAIRGEDYSNQGELILESYSDDRPKTTQKVKYSVADGKLAYEVINGEIHHKNEHTKFRTY